ncbi:MAG: hypothetical protein CBC28_01680 [Flavobacteriaceae bacterium TMED68]|nr:MAG: hypothetical protein CBC28_01680 [Flavobacteriaceae bacterium TMED68]|tara:strand:+ start:3771 stop:4733 length:963 start_codon:yes stop_codon:yes gene_type:complete
MKKHLITGITGQDGIFLTKEILSNNENTKIIGISRNKNTESFYQNLSQLNLNNFDNIDIFNIDLNNASSVQDFLISIKPDFIYNLAGPSSPYESIKNPEKYNQIENIFNNLVNGLIKNNNLCNFFQASSSEMFLANNNEKLNEMSPFGPKTPYAQSKLKNHKKILELREEYQWNIYSGIMFNHESEYRKDNYLIMKIINKANEISKKQNEKLTVGSLSYTRDWSFSGDISKAIYKITNLGKDGSYVIGSGKGHTIEKVIALVFKIFNLEMENHIILDESLLRKGDAEYIVSDPSKIRSELNWQTEVDFEELIFRCIELRT